MTRALAAAVATLVLGLAALACGGSEPASSPAPATQPPATEAAATEPAATATETPTTTPATEASATEASTPRATEAVAREEPDEAGDSEFEIVTLLPPDAIPAINDPRIITLEEADKQLHLRDLVIGVSIEGEHRAYGAAYLSGHEIVNDTLGGRAIAVTW